MRRATQQRLPKANALATSFFQRLAVGRPAPTLRPTAVAVLDDATGDAWARKSVVPRKPIEFWITVENENALAHQPITFFAVALNARRAVDHGSRTLPYKEPVSLRSAERLCLLRAQNEPVVFTHLLPPDRASEHRTKLAFGAFPMLLSPPGEPWQPPQTGHPRFDPRSEPNRLLCELPYEWRV